MGSASEVGCGQQFRERSHVYGALRHAEWNGLTVADLVFPAFVFLLGSSLWLSIDKQQRTGLSVTTTVVRLVRRALVLVLIGLALQLFRNRS